MFRISRKILTERVIGVDIDDRSIEIAELIKSAGGKPQVLRCERIALDFGIVEDGMIKDGKRLTKAFFKVLHQDEDTEIKLHGAKIAFSIAEKQIFFHHFYVDTPKSGRIEDARSDILKQIVKNIPIEEIDLVFDYRAIGNKDDTTSVLALGANRSVLRAWQAFFGDFGAKVEYFDAEILAAFSGLAVRSDKFPICFVDIGGRSTAAAIFEKNGLAHSISLLSGSDNLTKLAMEKLNLKYAQAEAAKIKHGLSDPNKKIFSVFAKALESIVNELKELLQYYEKNSGKKVENMLIIGGGSKLKGVVEYLEANLGVKVYQANSSLVRQKVPLDNLEAVGVALRALDDRFLRNDPILYLKAEKSVKAIKSLFKIKNLIALSYLILNKFKFAAIFAKHGKALGGSEVIAADKRRITIFRLIIISALILLLPAWWYRSAQQNERDKVLQEKVVGIAQMQAFNIRVPMAVVESERKSDRISARVVVDKILVAQDLLTVVSESMERIRARLGANELIWDEPIGFNHDNPAFPMDLRWIVYNNNEANLILAQAIEFLNTQKSEYIVNNIRKNALEPSNNPNVFYLSARVVISTHNPFPVTQENVENEPEVIETEIIDSAENATQEAVEAVIEEALPEETAKEDDIAHIEVLETETGWLNVRATPDLTADIVTQIYPGESYPLLDENEKWYKISVDDKIIGWIFKAYAIITD